MGSSRSCRTTRSRPSRPRSRPADAPATSPSCSRPASRSTTRTRRAGQRRGHPRSGSGQRHPAERLEPIAQNLLKFYPLPNGRQRRDSGNYFVEQPWTYGYDFQMVRVDHQWTEAKRTYVRWMRNFRREERYNWAGVQNGVQITQGSTDRFNLNVAVGHTAVAARLVPRRQGQLPALQRRPLAGHAFDPSNLGYPATTLALFRGYEHPALHPRVAAAARRRRRRHPRRPAERLQHRPGAAVLQPAVRADDHRSMGGHTIRVGYDWRACGRPR